MILPFRLREFEFRQRMKKQRGFSISLKLKYKHMNLRQVDQAGLVVYTTKITLRSVFDFVFKLHIQSGQTPNGSSC